MNRLFSLAFLCVSLALPSFGATATLRSTTFAAAVLASDQDVYVTSATGIEVGDIAYANKEAMRVRAINGVKLTVIRGVDGVVTAHDSGSTVYVDDSTYFSTQDRNGPCTATTEKVLPVINVASGRVWDCIGSVWTERVRGETATLANVGTANTGVTAVEFGDSKRHLTKLTFSGLTIGAPVGAANLAIGKLLYTFPAGAIAIKSATFDVTLAGSGSTCDADTPDVGLGTVIGSGATALLSGTATFEDILTGQTATDVNGTAIVKTVAGQPVVIEAASSARKVHLNVADGWAGACTVTGSGTALVDWILLQ